MDRSESAEPRFSTPRWLPLAVLAVACVLSVAQFWTQAFERLPQVHDLLSDQLSWSMAVFPNAIAFPFVFMIGPAGMSALLIIANLVVGIAFWRTQPPRLAWRRLAGLLAVWLTLSVLTTWAAPYLMKPFYDLTH